ncbi:hypothetical protein PsYK624_058050 [Phanerochaete sordida]|uniref:Protein kinase domain-containing protein n=1 Tax=Phanerochaete sordida TaxID=48140 RepID=A0A9P3G8D4_9APHY|nr:hypothetical protein PsYK624_058050 [Phanerochaete sordida]
MVSRTQSMCIGVRGPPGDANLFESWAGVDVKLADLGMGASCDWSCWAGKTGEYHTDLPSSSALRAPEACIGAGWGKPADIWSVACLAYELSMGVSLIRVNCDAYAVPFYQAFHFGNLPMNMLQRGQHSSHFYNEDGSLKMEFERRVSVEEMVRRRPPLHADLFIDFLKCAFALDPDQRPTTRELLEHEWLQH